MKFPNLHPSSWSEPDDFDGILGSYLEQAGSALGQKGGSVKSVLLDRARRAQKIVECPGKYKICEGCESIIGTKINICPNCHSYRYEYDENLVVAQARALGSREQQSPDLELPG